MYKDNSTDHSSNLFSDQDSQGSSDAHNGPLVLQALGGDGSSLPLPDASFVRDADLSRDGMDLVLEGPDGTIVIEGYFAAVPTPILSAPDGASLTPQLVDSFTQGPLEYADASGGATMADVSPVGAVQELTGEATVTRMDGTVDVLQIGTPIFQGDVIETSDEGAVNLVFVDETSFAVSEDARLAIDEYVFDPETQSGSTNFSVLKGVFVFTSGMIGREDPDDVMIETPVGSIGIRGTIIAGDINSGEITVVEGAIVLRDFSGNEMTLATQFDTARFNASNGEIEHMGAMDAGMVMDKFISITPVAPGLFSSIGDAAAEQGGGDEALGDSSAPDTVEQSEEGSGDIHDGDESAADGPEDGDKPEQVQGDDNAATGDEKSVDGQEKAANADKPPAEGDAPEGNTQNTDGGEQNAGEAPAQQPQQTTTNDGFSNDTGGLKPNSPVNSPAQPPPQNNGGTQTGGPNGPAPTPAPGAGDPVPDLTEPQVINNAPRINGITSSPLAEDVSTLLQVGQVNASDPDGNSLSYSIVGGGAGNFHIDSSGKIYSRAGATHDFDAGTPFYDLLIEVSDGTEQVRQNVRIDLTGVDDEAATLTENDGIALGDGLSSGGSLALDGFLHVDDVDTTDGSLVYNVTALPSSGQIEFTSNPGTSVSSFTQADLNNGTVVYVHDGSVTGADSFIFDITDGSGTNITGQSFDIAINVTNVAPVLDNTQTPVLTDIAEDDLSSAGNTVGNIVVDGSITDANGALEAIAVTAVDNSNGTWQYSTDAGSTWSNIGAVTNGNALLLDASAGIRFVPNADYNGTANFTFKAWDQSTGTVGNYADTNVGTAFSTATDTADITVTPVNDGPTVTTNTGFTVNEGLTVTITTGMLGTTDIDDAAAALTYTVTSVSLYGHIAFSGALATPITSFTQADIDGGTVVYVHDGSENFVDSFDVSVMDGGGSSDTATVSISVTPDIHDVLVGDGSDNVYVVTDADGNDSIDGQGGTDTYDGSAVTSNMTVDTSLSVGTVTDGTHSDDVSNVEIFKTGSGADTVTLANAGEEIFSGANADTITSQAGGQYIEAGTGADTIYLTTDTGWVYGDAGIDTVYLYQSGGSFNTANFNAFEGVENIDLYDGGSTDTTLTLIADTDLFNNDTSSLTVDLDFADTLIVDFSSYAGGGNFVVTAGDLLSSGSVTFTNSVTSDVLTINYASSDDVTIFGAAVPDLNLTAMTTTDGYNITDNISNGFGNTVSFADINHDGYDDLLMGREADDMLFTFKGNDTYATAPGASSNFDLPGTGQVSHIASIGDFDGDGKGDFIVGVPNYSGTYTDEGAAFIMAADGTMIHQVTGIAAAEQLGSSVSAAGDLNNDGYADVLIADASGIGDARIIYGGGKQVDMEVTNDKAFILKNTHGGQVFQYTYDAAGDLTQTASLEVGQNFQTVDSIFVHPTTNQGVVFGHNASGDGTIVVFDGDSNPMTQGSPFSDAELTGVTDVAVHGNRAFAVKANGDLVTIDDLSGTPTITNVAASNSDNLEILGVIGNNLFVHYDGGTTFDSGIGIVDMTGGPPTMVDVLGAPTLLEAAAPVFLLDVVLNASGDGVYALFDNNGITEIRSITGSTPTTIVSHTDSGFGDLSTAQELSFSSNGGGSFLAVTTSDGKILEIDISGPTLTDTHDNEITAAGGLQVAYGAGGQLIFIDDYEAGDIDAPVTTVPGLNQYSDVLNVGDLDEDGLQDIIFSRPDDSGQNGQVVIRYGGDLDNASSTETVFTNINDDDGGDHSIPLLNVGDIDGDGVRDIGFAGGGANSGDGEAYFIFGDDLTGQTIDVTTDLNGTNGFRVHGGGAALAIVAGNGVGDFNGDGIDDIAVAFKQPGGTNYAVDVFVVYGGNGLLADVSDGVLSYDELSEANHSYHITYTIPASSGATDADDFQINISAGGDVNGDGLADFVIGTPDTDNGGTVDSDGTAYVVYGQSTETDDIIQAATAAPTVIANWTFNDSIGLTINDVSGSGNHLQKTAITGVINGNQGVLGGAVNFDGSDDYYTASGIDLQGQDFTISMSLNLNSLISNTTLFSQDYGGGNSFEVFVDTGGNINVMVNGSNVLTSSTALTTGQWSNITLTIDDSSDRVDLYLDGTLDSSNASYVSSITGTALDFTVGRSLGGGDFLNGSIDSLQILDGAVAPTASIDAIANDDHLLGNEADNVLNMVGFNDVSVSAGAGQDLIKIDDDDFERIDGGGGFDVVQFDNANIDFSNVGALDMMGVEALNMGNDSLAQTVTLTLDNIMNLLGSSDTGALWITAGGDANDRLIIADASNTGIPGDSSTLAARLEDELGLADGSITVQDHNGYDTFEIGSYRLNIDDVLIGTTDFV